MNRTRKSAFTLIEMLVVISIIGLLMSILLPAVNNARNQAKLTQSKSNLKNLGVAHGSYASEWKDRQFTLAVDTIANYGSTPDEAAVGYHDVKGQYPPPIPLGWTRAAGGAWVLWSSPFDVVWAANRPNMAPINFATHGGTAGFGWFRIPNAKPLSNYLSGRFYDPVYYAPKDTIVQEYVKPALESPYEFTPSGVPGTGVLPTGTGWSSYCLSAAALFAPTVMANPTKGGWKDPWSVPAGMRAPAMSQASYSNLKTHMLEHHWLQNTRLTCNPNILDDDASYDECEPFFFNHSWESSPVALFYDGHVETLGVRAAQRADLQHRTQVEDENWGLWSKDTELGEAGYFIDLGYDFAGTSFHVLTTDGIRGRDVISE